MTTDHDAGDAGVDVGDVAESLDPPMCVVTTIAGGERAGCLVGFHTQCSITPVRLAVWLSKANHTFRVGSRAEHFAIHHLTSGDRALARHFGTTTGDDGDKFRACRWHEGPGEVPVLDDCANAIVGRRVAMLDDGGDHVCFVIEPIEVTSSGTFRPLRQADVLDLEPGHGNEERPFPPTERAASAGT